MLVFIVINFIYFGNVSGEEIREGVGEGIYVVELRDMRSKILRYVLECVKVVCCC